MKLPPPGLLLLLCMMPVLGHADDNEAAICAASSPLDGGTGWCRKILSDMAALRNPRLPTWTGAAAGGSKQSREKQSALFYGKIVPSAYGALPRLSDGLFLGFESLVAGAHGVLPSQTPAADGDELPPERWRYKAMNTFGTAALFDFVADPGTPFTGIFKGGSGVMRFSYAGPPGLVGNVPGVGLKFFVDGKPSQNLVLMNSFSSQGPSTDVFLKPFSNELPEPDSVVMKAVKRLFEKASGKSNVLRQDLANLGAVASDGSAPAAPSTPYRVFLQPTQDDGISAGTTNDFRSDLARVKPGTAVYDVMAVSSPGAEKIHIGRIVTQSPFVASEYGDKALTFRHN